MKYRTAVFICAVSLLAAAAASATSQPSEDFEHGMAPGWTTQGLGPQPDQGVAGIEQESGGNHFLRISTNGSFYSIGIDAPFNANQYPILSWRWRVDRLPEGADVPQRNGDDAVARVFVIFRNSSAEDPSSVRKIEYVWDTTHPAGTVIPEPYSPATVKAIVQESGSSKVGQWVRERVNLVSDYQRAFGSKPELVKTIAFASDSSETRTSTSTDFDDLQVSAATQTSTR
ncbi:MAG TPA: DUF3047 domain-containing protein [Candidatus Binataceae bacterium]|nr:DUF3047 domain-containing protein [Candidatus Binataceae bacterium]